MAHTFTNLLTHIIFSTKDRMPMLDAHLKERLLPYIGGIFRELGATPLLINGPTDHRHVLTVLPARIAVSEILNKVKTNSSRWVHKEFPNQRTFAWQTGYAAFSVSSSQKEAVLEYIANQEEHHRKISFKEEFVSFLKKHEIEHHEKYLWE
ncbi:MAG TPA: IS200/IS605 family transposase [Verrucomicrobiae bacterium]|jgi:REP element-mobilizing transposase RayT|nr:IS200/IS605 family transposase [Verrucomicrobiae bacterium]